MTTLLGLSGSLRRHSYNSGLLRAARSLAPADVAFEVADIAAIPLYNGDDERQAGIPKSVGSLKDAIAGADGLVIATPEYNNSIPGVLKNAIDWASRPASDIRRVFGGKPVSLMGASPGGFGTVLSQNAWLPVFRTLGAQVWTGSRMLVPGAGKAFDAEGNLVDEAVREKLRLYLLGFAEFARRG